MILQIREDIDISTARRAAGEQATQLGMDKYQTGEVVISVSELATNLVRHATEGELEITTIHEKERTGLQITSRDKGPGIPDLNLAMQEGYSTGGSMGSGLPGVKRMMDEFRIESQPGQGTIITTIKWLK